MDMNNRGLLPSNAASCDSDAACASAYNGSLSITLFGESTEYTCTTVRRIGIATSDAQVRAVGFLLYVTDEAGTPVGSFSVLDTKGNLLPESTPPLASLQRSCSTKSHLGHTNWGEILNGSLTASTIDGTPNTFFGISWLAPSDPAAGVLSIRALVLTGTRAPWPYEPPFTEGDSPGVQVGEGNQTMHLLPVLTLTPAPPATFCPAPTPSPPTPAPADPCLSLLGCGDCVSTETDACIWCANGFGTDGVCTSSTLGLNCTTERFGILSALTCPTCTAMDVAICEQECESLENVATCECMDEVPLYTCKVDPTPPPPPPPAEEDSGLGGSLSDILSNPTEGSNLYVFIGVIAGLLVCVGLCVAGCCLVRRRRADALSGTPGDKYGLAGDTAFGEFSTATSSYPNEASSTASFATGGANDESFKQESWWQPTWSSDDAERELSDPSHALEAIVRPSSQPGAFAMSFNDGTTVGHILVSIEGASYAFDDEFGGRRVVRQMDDVASFMNLKKYSPSGMAW